MKKIFIWGKKIGGGHTGEIENFHQVFVQYQAQRVFPQLSMLCPALLMAWLATMPQFLFMPQQQSTFSEWALTTVVPAVFLLLEAPNPGPAQLGACLALVHGLGQGQPGERPRRKWEHPAGGGRKFACTSVQHS
jgi:hypothetical protein